MSAPDSKPSFKTRAKRKCIIRSVPVFETESTRTESETDAGSGASPMHSKYIQGVLRRKVSHDPTFGVYQDDADGSFKIGRSKFKFSNKHAFIDGRRYTATTGVWELLTKSRPDKNTVTNQDRQAYKQILLQSNAHGVHYSPIGRIRANKGVKYTRFISRIFNDTPKQQIDCETGIMSLCKFYYDPQHNAGFGSVSKLVEASKNKRKDVQQWLSSQDTYTLHKPVRKIFPRNAYTVPNLDDVWEIDLAELTSLSKYNHHV
jgi:hypothetical protein